MKSTASLVIALTAATAIGSAGTASGSTILVSEGFAGDGSGNLAGTGADTFDADLVTAGGSATWAGSANIKTDGAAYGNNVKVVYLALGSYIDDAKGNTDAIFELTATLGPNGTQRGSSLNWLSFSTASAPPVNDTTTMIGSIGIDAQGDAVASSFGPGVGGLSTAATTAGDHTVTITLDLTAANYDGVTSFGKITLDDSVAGALGSTTLTSDQSFAAIAMYVAAGVNQGSRTDSRYSGLTLTQVPEPGSLALLGIGGLCLMHRRRA